MQRFTNGLMLYRQLAYANNFRFDYRKTYHAYFNFPGPGYIVPLVHLSRRLCMQ